MSCRCSGKRADRIGNWGVLARNVNHSKFNGSRATPSDYSLVCCTRCGEMWRTKAKYVDTLGSISLEAYVAAQRTCARCGGDTGGSTVGRPDGGQWCKPCDLEVNGPRPSIEELRRRLYGDP